MWKKILAVAHPTGQRFRQQIWPTARLTRRQKRVFGRLNRIYSAELRRSTKVSSIQKLVLNKQQKVWNNFEVVNAVKAYPNYCDSSDLKLHSNICNNYDSYNDWRSAPIKGSLAVMRARITRPLWIYKNPATVPGVVKVRKTNWLHGRQLRAAQSLNSWLGRIQGRKVVAMLQRAWVKKGAVVWNWASALEALWPVLLVKAGFQTAIPGASNVVKYGLVMKNGAIHRRALAVAHPGDVISVNTKTLYSNTKHNTTRCVQRTQDCI